VRAERVRPVGDRLRRQGPREGAHDGARRGISVGDDGLVHHRVQLVVRSAGSGDPELRRAAGVEDASEPRPSA